MGITTKGRLGNTVIIITQCEWPKGQRYAPVIEGDENVCKVVGVDRDLSRVELTSCPASGLLCCPEAM